MAKNGTKFFVDTLIELSGFFVSKRVASLQWLLFRPGKGTDASDAESVPRAARFEKTVTKNMRHFGACHECLIFLATIKSSSWKSIRGGVH